MSVLLRAEVQHLQQAIRSAKAARTALAYLDIDDVTQHLMRSAEATVQALEAKLAATRYRLRQAEEVRQ